MYTREIPRLEKRNIEKSVISRAEEDNGTETYRHGTLIFTGLNFTFNELWLKL